MLEFNCKPSKSVIPCMRRHTWARWRLQVGNDQAKTMHTRIVNSRLLALHCVLFFFFFLTSIVSPKGHVFCLQEQFSDCRSGSVWICDMTIKNIACYNGSKTICFHSPRKIEDRNHISYVSCLIWSFTKYMFISSIYFEWCLLIRILENNIFSFENDVFGNACCIFLVSLYSASFIEIRG